MELVQIVRFYIYLSNFNCETTIDFCCLLVMTGELIYNNYKFVCF